MMPIAKPINVVPNFVGMSDEEFEQALFDTIVALDNAMDAVTQLSKIQGLKEIDSK